MEIIHLLETSVEMLILLSGLIGLMVGSFLNVVIHRLPKMMEQEWREQCAEIAPNPNETSTGTTPQESVQYNLVAPRSACPSCGHRISAMENIPVLSYLVLGGRCRGCKARISLRYPVVELISGLLCAYSAWHFGFSTQALVAPLLIWALIALTFIDFDTQLLPDSITLALIWLGLLVNLNLVFTSLSSAVIGAMAGYLSLWSVYWLFKLSTGKEGMGFGDFKLLAAIGAWLGWQILPLTLLLSSIVGAVVGITLILFAGHGRQIPIPFGPYLAGGGLIALFWGKPLTQAYLGLAL
ncbi:MAG: A24 family peptidase [Sulfuricellaceae bacterium]|nr:A24 family peptidase [Sulfuricellaceae bacterium]